MDEVSLRDYLEKLIIAYQNSHADVHKAEREAGKKAKEDNDIRMKQLNDLRQEVVYDRNLFVHKEAIEERLLRIEAQVQESADNLLVIRSKSRDEIESAKKYINRAMIFLSVLTIALNILFFFLS